MKWFESWFDTSYYHALYQHRNEGEAAKFVDTLISYLQLKSGERVADIACGKGRHSAQLAAHGLAVWGMDLSENSIAKANDLQVGGAVFQVHDMRETFPQHGFKAVFNLFTSFGYFDDPADDLKVLINMCAACAPGGYVVQDYLNAASVIGSLPQSAECSLGGYDFKTKKYRTENHIVKDIWVRDGDADLAFQEQVRIFSQPELAELHQLAGLGIVGFFGDYALGNFDDKMSPRIVVISKKS
ncbi:MAG: class I SAM-dependent methyltransferase [Flavobacteriaceae bacterium]|nr:class I SAM-dependent methyltransferase [Flavobacteriaceae bacterium]